MTMNHAGAERSGLMGVSGPAGAGTTNSGWVDASDFQTWHAAIAWGAITGTIDAKIEQATDGAGTGAKDAKVITQASGAAGEATIHLRPEELDVEGGFTHIRLQVARSGATEACGMLIGFDARHGDGIARQPSSVVENVT